MTDITFTTDVMLKNSLGMSEFKIFVEIFEFLDVINIIASWEKLIMVFSEANYVSYVSWEAKFSSYWLVLSKVVDYLIVE